jgi:DNA recombination protein RmuC
MDLFIGLVAGILISGLIFWFIYILKTDKTNRKIRAYIREYESKFEELNEENRVLNHSFQETKIEIIKLNEEIIHNKNIIEYLDKLKEENRAEFQNIATEILEKNTHKLGIQNSQNMQNIINPFKQNIKEFNEKIENYYLSESKERFSLTKEIKNLKELNYKISQDAINLTNALKGDNKLQGNWGELILQRVLENSGLKEGREYEIQKEYRDKNDDKYRPDVIVHLPDTKHIIIDSKVSLIAYEKYFNENSSIEDKNNYLKEFLNSINLHIRSLSSKSYQELKTINSLDYVLMFIPIEGAFMLALDKDRDLYNRAYQYNIILVSPSTLLAVLRTIENSWRFEYQNKNAQIIAKKAGDLYDKFAGFLEEMQKIDNSLHKAQQSYNDAFKKLSSGKGNLMNRANELKELEGVYNKKSLNNIEAS